MGILFDDRERDDTSIRQDNERLLAFLDRVAGPVWDRIRALLEDWLSRYCSDWTNDLIAGLQESDDRAFFANFWELYIHETLVRSGHEVVCHPSLEHTLKRPDFFARRGEEVFYVEARVVSQSNDDVKAEARRQRVYSQINGRLESPDFVLWVEVGRQSTRDFPIGDLVTQLRDWLASLERAEVSALNATDIRDLPSMDWVDSDDEWHLRFTALPRSDAAVEAGHTEALGVFGSLDAQMIDDRSPIKRSLDDKGGRYGELDAPYIVAVGLAGMFMDNQDVVDALFGSTAVRVGPDSAEEFHQADGFWSGPKGPQYTRVSAVLSAKDVSPWSFTKAAPRLWLNPWAARPLSISVPLWEMFSVDLEGGTSKVTEPQVTPFEFFGVEEDWPGPELPFPAE